MNSDEIFDKMVQALVIDYVKEQGPFKDDKEKVQRFIEDAETIFKVFNTMKQAVIETLKGEEE